MNDHELLHDYLSTGSQSAFTQLVERHLPLVWSAARRHVSDADLGRDVSQQVFTLLARKANRLEPTTILSGWLYRTTCHIASRLARSERRRLAREREAVSMANDDDSNSWLQIEPLLDAAMAKLNEPDRDAIVLRYFEKKNLKEVAAALGTNDDAVQKRLSRALDKLRHSLAQRGIQITAGSLITAIGVGSIQPAPAALATTVAAVAVLSSTTTTVSLISAAMIKPILAAAAVVALTSTTLLQYKSNHALRTELNATRASLQEQENKQQAAPPPVSFRDAPEFTELLRLRAEVSRLRALEPELAKLKGELASARNALAAARTTPPTEAAAAVQAAPDEVKTRQLSNLKQIGLGLRMLANANKEAPYLVDGRLSPQIVEYLGGNDNAAMKLFQNVTLLVPDTGTMQKLEREAPMRVVAHSINAFQSADGRWSRLYLHADGHVKERHHASADEIWDGTQP